MSFIRPSFIFTGLLVALISASVLSHASAQRHSSQGNTGAKENKSVQVKSKAAKIIRIQSDVFMPYINYQEADKKGFVIDLLQTTLEEEGYQVEFYTTTWQGMLQAFRSKSADCIPVVSAETVESLGKPVPSTPITTLRHVIFGLKANSDLPTRPEHFSENQYHFGSIEGYQLPERIIQTLPGKHLGKTISGEDPVAKLLDSLIKSEVDLIFANLFTIRYQSKLSRVDDQIKLLMEFKEFEQEQFVVCQDPKIQLLIEEAIIKAKETGLFGSLVSRYI